MHLGLRDAIAAWKQGEGRRCPGCGADRFRASRRDLSGVWSKLTRTRLVSCIQCGLRFPSASRRLAAHDTRSIPFSPLELDEAADGRPLRPALLMGGLICPRCESMTIRPAPSASPVMGIFEVRVLYRCTRCNASYSRVSVTRVVVRFLIFVLALGGALYLVTSGLRLRSERRTPQLRQNQIPPPAPPVLR